MSVAASCLAAVLVATAVVVAVPQTSDNPLNDDDRQARGLRFGWNTMDGARRSCVGMNGRPGVCMGEDQCSNMNGKSVGKCFPFDSCCSITPNSCGGYSGFSTAYFQSPDKFQEVCTYKINVRRNVCQIRIDFEKFSLGQPTKQHNESAYYCGRDEFTLLSSDNKKMNLPVLCGENSGQHVYVPVKQQTSLDSKNRQHVTLRFRLTARDEGFTDPEPLWKLKISQLECPHTQNSWLKIKDIARQVWDWEEEDRDVGEKSKYSLAPDGCLQYFTDEKGSFESFNYNRGMGHYVANLNYAVCFKRYHDSCGIRHDAVKFQIAYRQDQAGFTDRDCDTAAASPQPTTAQPTTLAPPATTAAPPATTAAPPATTAAPPATTAAPPATTGAPPATTGAPPATTGAPPATTGAPTARRSAAQALEHAIFFAETGLVRVDSARGGRGRSHRGNVRGDYLIVPDGVYAGGQLAASKYCGDSMERRGNYVSAIAQGPLFVAFVSDDYSNPGMDVEKGFKINYSLINTGC